MSVSKQARVLVLMTLSPMLDFLIFQNNHEQYLLTDPEREKALRDPAMTEKNSSESVPLSLMLVTTLMVIAHCSQQTSEDVEENQARFVRFS